MSIEDQINVGEISSEVRQMAREFGELCARNRVRRAWMEFETDRRTTTGQDGTVKVFWSEGRHGAEAGEVRIQLHQTRREKFPVDYEEFRRVRSPDQGEKP